MTLVSAILPTRGRRELAAKAVKCFIDQTYANRELVILDDIQDRSFPNGVLDIPHCGVPVIYLMHESRSIAEKRNLCCKLAKGEIICHFDSDDYSEPTRIADQVKLLEESSMSVAGFHSLLFHVESSGQCFKYVNDRSYALGTSLCYLRSFQEIHPFRQGQRPNAGEDNEFVKDARNIGELISVDAGQMMVARIHEENTDPKETGGPSYRRVLKEALPKGFFA